ncbi:MAG: hypothetical protein K2M17_02690 [Bacilli bacterium]|nr:hypothetical protein [Bacilli bacterium]
MNKKQIVDLITAVILILCGSILLTFPLFNVINIKIIFASVLGIYTIMNLIQFGLTYESKDYEGLFTAIASLIVLLIVLKLNVNEVPWYLAIALFIWIILMSLIKLKKADYYHDRRNNGWILKVVCLILFIFTGLLATINLYYTNDVQVLVLGFFYLIHGILELLDPLTLYLIEKK